MPINNTTGFGFTQDSPYSEEAQNTPTINDYIDEYLGNTPAKNQPISPIANGFFAPPKNQKQEGVREFDLVKRDVPVEAIYDRLSDGSYSKKYDNYKGAFGNEDRLAKEQSGWDQFLNGVTKNLLKVGTYALDGTVGLAYGIYNGIANGEFNKVWDNGFSNYLDDINKQLDNAMPNYYSDEQKAMGVLESMTTMNFWANDFAGGLAFVGGAVLPSVVTGGVLGSTTLGTKLARAGASSTFKQGAKEATEAVAKSTLGKAGQAASNTLKSIDEFSKFSKGRDIIRGGHRAILGDKVGDITSTIGFLARSSSFEAGMEARHNLHQSIDMFYSDFKEKNGREPSPEEISEFMESAVSAGNSVFTSNMAILGVSNSVMFGRSLGIGKIPGIRQGLEFTNKIGNRVIGLGTKADKVGKLSMRGANKAQKFLGNAYLIGRKPFYEGFFEEGLQGVAGSSMQSYLETLYDPNATEAESMFSMLPDAFAKQYTEKEGMKEVVIGMLIGMVGGGVSNPKSIKQGTAFEGFGQLSRKSLQKQKEKQIVAVNDGIENLTKLNRASSVRNFVNLTESGAETDSELVVEDAYTNYQFITSQEGIKSQSNMIADYDVVIDNTPLDDSSKQMLEDANISEEDYKSQLKSQFKKNLKDYNFSNRVVNSLAIDSVELPNGEKRQIKDAVRYNIYLGKRSLEAAEQVSKQIEQIVGQDGLFSHMMFFENLSEEQKNNVRERRAKQKQLDYLKEKAREYGSWLSTNRRPERLKRDLKTDTLDRKVKDYTERLVLVNQQTAELQREINKIDEVLGSEFRKSEFSLDEKLKPLTESGGVAITDAIQEINKLEKYREDLEKSGNKFEAESIDYLVKQFKTLANHHRNTVNMVRDLYETDYFSSTEGRSLIQRIGGKKYTMSEDFKKILRDNDNSIDQAMNRVGIRNKQIDFNVEEVFKEILEENKEIPERQKYKIESMFRLILAQNDAVNTARAILDDNATIRTSAEKVEQKRTPLDGDTIVIREGLDLKLEDLTSLEKINQAIEEITKAIDNVMSREDINAERIADLNRRKSELEALKEKSKKDTVTSEEILLTSLKQDLVEEEKRVKEGVGNEEILQNIKDEISQIEEAIKDNKVVEAREEELERIDEDIKIIEEEIESLKKPFKITQSEDYLRYLELAKEKENRNLTNEEKLEFEALEREIDQWLLFTGAVYQGFRLSDLVREKALLEEIEVAQEGDVSTVEKNDTEVKEEYFEDTGDNANYKYSLTYDVVVASGTKDGVKLHNINLQQIEEKIGFKIDPSTVSYDEKGNVILSLGTVNRINTESNLRILPDGGTYSIVMESLPSAKEGDPNRLYPLKSQFSEEFNNSEGHDIDAIYDIDLGEQVILQIDPKDPYNVELIEEYKAAKTDTERQEVKDKIKKKLLIRATVRLTDSEGNSYQAHVGTLKGFNNGRKDKQADVTFEAMRSAIVENEAQFEEFLNGESKFDVTVETEQLDEDGNPIFSEPNVTVTKTLLGRINYNFYETENGLVVREKQITEEEAKSVIDIGYIQGDEVKTKNGTSPRLSYLSKLNKSGKKVPFIVVRRGIHDIAIPVNVNERMSSSTQEFEDIWNSDVNMDDKIFALNRYLADKGIDIKVAGKGFSLLDKETHSQEFFEQKLAELKNMKYFYDLDNWVKKGTDMVTTLTTEVRVNFDILNPIHSPKLILDYSKVELAKPDVIIDSEKVGDGQRDSASIGEQLRMQLEEEKEEDC
jgi:hypothetical protein